MERAFALSSPPILPKLPPPNPNFRISILPPPNLIHSISSSPFSKSPSSPLRFGTWISPNRTPQNRLSTQASSVPETAGEDSEPNVSCIQARSVPEIVGEDSEPNSRFFDSVKLGFLIGFWYSVNIYFNIVNKQILNVYPFPVTISALQFAVGTVLSLLMWAFNIYKKPRISTSQLVAIFPLAVGHALGNIFTNTSLVKVAVSFTQTIKSMEPFFTVVLSALFLGVMPTFWVVSSLVPVVGGVVLASATEASFDWAGFWSAMISNLTNQSRNVFSKKLMANKEESLDNITLFSIITIMSFFITLPVTLFMEGVKFTPAYLQSAGFNVKEICMQCLLGGILYHAYQQIAYMILQKVSPVTHAVSNSVKRVVIIVASVLFFRTATSPINALGTAVALLGVFLYSRATQIKPKLKVT